MKIDFRFTDDGASAGLPFLSEEFSVTIENGKLWPPDTIDAFTGLIAGAIKHSFGNNAPRVFARINGRPWVRQ
jgi:hypothetical protein